MSTVIAVNTEATERGAVSVMPVKTPPALSLCSLSLHPSEALEERKCRCVVSVFTSSSLRLPLSPFCEYGAPRAKTLKPSAVLSRLSFLLLLRVSPALSLHFTPFSAPFFRPLIVRC